jgi:hypothetical protein
LLPLTLAAMSGNEQANPILCEIFLLKVSLSGKALKSGAEFFSRFL